MREGEKEDDEREGVNENINLMYKIHRHLPEKGRPRLTKHARDDVTCNKNDIIVHMRYNLQLKLIYLPLQQNVLALLSPPSSSLSDNYKTKICTVIHQYTYDTV